MKASGALALLGLALLGAPAVAEPTVATAIEGRSRIVTAGLDGTIVAAGSVEGTLWLLVRPPGEPDGVRRLLRIGLGAAPTIEDRGAVPGWSKSLHAVDLGSGPELLVGGLGRVATLGSLRSAGGSIRILVEDPDVDLRSAEPGTLRSGVRSSVVAAGVGRLRRFVGDGDGLVERGAWALPVSVRAEHGGLRLASPPAQLVERPDAEALVAIGPEAQGRTRLRSLVVDPGVEEPLVAWSDLRSPEEVEQHRFVLVDGRPFLIVRTQSSDRLNLFERLRLRVLPLAADRTRSGFGTSFAAELDSKRWHDPELSSFDVDGDHRDDLVVLRPEGFRGKDLVVEVWPGRGGGRFDPRSRRVDLSGPIEGGVFGPDLDGDGRADVLTVGEEAMALHAGRGGGSNPVRRKPEWTVPLAAPGDSGDAEPSREAGTRILGPLDGGGLLVRSTSRDGWSTIYLIQSQAGGA